MHLPTESLQYDKYKLLMFSYIIKPISLLLWILFIINSALINFIIIIIIFFGGGGGDGPSHLQIIYEMHFCYSSWR